MGHMKRKLNFFLVTGLAVIFAIAADIFAVYQLNNYETRFLEIYGAQQDGYVKVVLEQVNRLGGTGTEESVTEIIASLDATASRYWTLSKGSSLLFVKSVMETGRYQGFADGTYYAGETASAFLDGLKRNQVGHQVISLDGDRFVASGTVFGWKGEDYRICLLTYDKAVLEDNMLLECRNSIIIVLSLVLALLIILSMAMSRKISKQQYQIGRQESREIWQNQQLEQLDMQLKQEYAFSASRHVFRQCMLDGFLDALYEKGVHPLHFAVFLADSKEARETFFEKMQEMLDNNVLRFAMEGQKVLLVFAGYQKAASERLVGELESGEVHKAADLYCGGREESYKEQFYRFWEAAGTWETQRHTGNTG